VRYIVVPKTGQVCLKWALDQRRDTTREKLKLTNLVNGWFFIVPKAVQVCHGWVLDHRWDTTKECWLIKLVSSPILFYMVGTQLFLQLKLISWPCMVREICTIRLNKLLIIKTAIIIFIKKNITIICTFRLYMKQLLSIKNILP